MSTFYEVLDRSSGNAIKDYATEEAAIAELRSICREHGFDEVRNYALLRFDDGHPTLVAMEDELVARLQEDEIQVVASFPLLNPTPLKFFEFRSSWASSVKSTALVRVDKSMIPLKNTLIAEFRGGYTTTRYMDLHCV